MKYQDTYNWYFEKLINKIFKKIERMKPFTSEDDIQILTFKRFLSVNGIVKKDRKNVLSYELVVDYYYDHLYLLIDDYLDRHPEIRKRDFFRKHNVKQKFLGHEDSLL